MGKSIIKDSSGLLLLEVLGVSVIIILTSLVFGAMYVSSSTRIQASRSQTLASSAAFSILEALHQSNQEISWTESGWFVIPADLDPGVEIPAGMTACLETVPMEENKQLLWAKARVEWDGKKERESVDMVTLLQKNSY